MVLSATVATQLPNCPCGQVKILNPLGNDVVYVGGLPGSNDVPYAVPNNPGLGRGTPIFPGNSAIFQVVNANLLTIIATRDGDIVVPQFMLSMQDFITPTADPGPNLVTLPPLTILSTSPANSSTGVPQTAMINILFSRQLDPTSLVPNNITISPTVTDLIVYVDPLNPNQIVLNPNTSILALGTSYTVTVNTNAVTDTNGIALGAPYIFSFITFIPPTMTVTSVTPGNNASNIPINATIAIVMNVQIIAADVSNSNVQLIRQSDSSVVPSNVSLDVDGRTMILTPNNNLLQTNVYYVVVQNLRNLIGATMSPSPWNGASQGPNKGLFTVTSAGGPPIPAVVSVTPGSNASGVDVNTVVTTSMNTPVLLADLTGTNVKLIKDAGSSTVPSTLALSGDGLTITVTPSSPLVNSNAYYMTITGMHNTVGQIMVGTYNGKTSSPANSGLFTTAPVGAPTPTVSTCSPGNNTTGVAINTAITVVMNTAINPAEITTGNVLLIRQSDSAVIPRGVGVAGDNKTITITPSSNLTNNTAYYVEVQNQHNVNVVLQSPNPWYGDSRNSNIGLFTTVALPAPTVFSVTPGSNAMNVATNTTIVVVMNMTITPGNVNTSNFKLIRQSDSVSIPLSSASIAADNKTITMTPSSILDNSTAYYVYVQSQTSTLGQIQSPNPWYGDSRNGSLGLFTTIISPPNVSSCSPGNSVGGIALNTHVTVVMTEPVKVAGVTPTNVKLIKVSDGSTVTSSVSLGADSITITITPSASLLYSTQYKVIVQNLQNLVSETQIPNPWDGISQGNAGTFTTTAPSFTQRYNVSINSSPCTNSIGYGPATDGLCEEACGPGNGMLGTAQFTIGVNYGETASIANGLTTSPITKVVIPSIMAGTVNSNGAFNNSVPSGSIGVKIINSSGTTKYTFSSTFSTTSTGYTTVCSNATCSCASGAISGYTNIILSDINNIYTMVVGDIILITWSGTSNNVIAISQNTSGPYGKAVYQDSNGNLNTISGMDVSMTCYSSP